MASRRSGPRSPPSPPSSTSRSPGPVQIQDKFRVPTSRRADHARGQAERRWEGPRFSQRRAISRRGTPVRGDNGVSAGLSFHAGNRRAGPAAIRGRPCLRPGADLTTINEERMRIAHLDDLALASRSLRALTVAAGQILFRADDTTRASVRRYMSAGADARRRYDNIFSRNRGYLRRTCLAVCGPRPRTPAVRSLRKQAATLAAKPRAKRPTTTRSSFAFVRGGSTPRVTNHVVSRSRSLNAGGEGEDARKREMEGREKNQPVGTSRRLRNNPSV